jgi:hypothetical protein
MLNRNVKISDVYATTRNPDETYEDCEHSTLVSVKKINAKFILLVYRMENDEAKVITLFYTTKLDRLLKTKKARGAWKKTK